MSRLADLKKKLISYMGTDKLVYPIIAGIVAGLVVAVLTAPVTSSYARYFVAGTLVHGELPEIDIRSKDPYLKPRWVEPRTEEYEPELRISSSEIKQDREIFRPGENVTISFDIWNTKELPYNVTVDWLHDDSREHGWSIRSTEIYNTSNPDNDYYSWFQPKSSGEWRVQVIVEYTQNQTQHTETVVKSFEVV